MNFLKMIITWRPRRVGRIAPLALVIISFSLGLGSVLPSPAYAAASCEVDLSFKINTVVFGDVKIPLPKFDICDKLIGPLKNFLNEDVVDLMNSEFKNIPNQISMSTDDLVVDVVDIVKSVFKTILKELPSNANDFIKEEPVGGFLNPSADLIFSSDLHKEEQINNITKYLQECPDPDTEEGKADLKTMANTVDAGIAIVEDAFEAKGLPFTKLDVSQLDVTSDDTLANYWEARRKLDWFTEHVHDNMPDDVFTVTGKLLVEGFYLNANRLTTCLEYYNDIATWNGDDGVFANFDTIQTNQTTHDANIKAGQTVLATQVQMHDSDIKAGQTELETQIQTHDNDIKAGQDALSTQIAGLDNDIGVDLEALMVQAQAAQDQMVRIQIERTLADRSNAKGSDYFYLPAAQGGLIEVVRQTVLEAINNNEAAGIKVDQAKKNFNQAEDAFAASDFEKAYDEYAQAYKQLTK